MLKKILFPLIMFFILIQNSSAESGFETKYFNSFLKGDYTKQYELIANYINVNPSSSYSSILLDMIIDNSDAHGFDKVLKLINDYDQKINAGDLKSRNEAAFLNYLRYLDFTEDYNYKTEIYKDYNFIKNWKVSKRFNKYGLYDIYNKFSPESKNDLLYKNVESEKDGYVHVSDNVYPSNGIYYFSSFIQSGNEIYIIVEADEYYKLFVNDIEVANNFYQTSFYNKRIFKIKGTGKYKITLKMLTYDDSNFRVWVVDKNFKKVNVKYNAGILPLPVSFFEKRPYPYHELFDTKTEISDIFKAKYLYFLGSRKFSKYYKKIKNHKEAVETMYAVDLLNFYSSNSYKSDIAWKKMSNLWKNTQNIPAQRYKFESEIENGNIKKALSILKNVREKVKYYDIEMEYLDFCYEKNYYNMFKHQLKRMNKYFSKSTYPLFYKFRHYYSLNNKIMEKTGLDILKIYRDVDVSKKLIKYYKSNGNYDKSLKQIKQSSMTKYRKKLEIAKLDLVFKNYKGSHDKLMDLLAVNESPEVLFYLGLIEEKQGRTSDLYWAKLEKYDPQYDFPTDYSSYVENKKHESRFESIRDKSYVEKEINKFIKDKSYLPSSMIYNGEFYKLYANGKASYFKEQLIYINSDSDVDKYGEYRIPFSNNYNILFVKVIRKSGEVEYSYKRNESRSGTFVTISGVEKNSLIHVAYEVNNYNFLYPGSSLVSTNLRLLQEYNQSIGMVSVKVETENKNILLYNNKGLQIKTQNTENGKLYSFSALNLPSSIKRYYDGDIRKNMLSYGFTNVLLTEDFINWYRGYFSSYDNDSKNYIIFKKNESEERIISTIYNKIARDYETTGDLNFYPENPEDTYMRQSGTVEDKVFLTQSILSSYGIESYPALVKDENLQLGVVNLDNQFSGILLYIPKYDMWLDYSSRYYGVGTVQSKYEANRAVIIYKRKIGFKKIKTKNETKILRNISIDLSNSNSEKVEIDLQYFGTMNYLRKYFLDERKYELIVAALLTSFSNKVIINNYKVRNLESYKKPLVISCDGRLIGFSVRGQDSMTFKPFIMPSIFTGYLVESSRDIDLVVENSEMSTDKYIIHVNELYNDEEINFEKRVKFKSSFVNYKISKEKNSTDVFVEKIIHFEKQNISPKDFNDFMKFCIEVRKTDDYRIVLEN